ncbi:MAG: apolipoprotein N-acyltransferase [Treponema sp.]|nr:apolipoprotein N-acyltransferase [Treponema sp.]
MSTWRQGWVKNIFINLGLILLGVLLFAGAFPNLLVEKGLPLFAWFAYIPVFILIRRVSLGASPIWGALYGYSAYGLFNYWLSVFHPLAGLIVGLIYLVYLAVLFFFLKLADLLFHRRAWLVQWVIWMAYEYLRTQGFLGYSYGITGYSQWTLIPVIQIADTLGVWGVSALVIFPSAWFAQALWETSQDAAFAGGFAGYAGALRNFFLKEKIASLAWAGALCAVLAYGFITQVDYSAFPSARIALVQHNTDPWLGGIAEYRRNYQVLRRLSDEALRADPKPDLVVWSETAFVPRIYWHITYRDDPPSWVLVRELLDYLRLQDVPFLIGNDDARKDPAKNPDPRDDYRVDYNAVMLFEGGDLTALYRKLHLVPFTEHFPYKKQFPRIYQALKNADTHFWEKGAEATVFSLPGFSFSSPVCFEDTFGYLSREFVRNGAEIIVNLSNDAWSKSLPAQNQHLSMAVFRAVENRRAMARSTASGQTCAVDPNGRVIAMVPPFTESWITVEVPVMKTTTLYTRYGDFLAWFFVAAAGALLILGLVSHIIKIVKKKSSVD